MSRSKTNIIAEIAVKFNPKNFNDCYICATSNEEPDLIRAFSIGENDILFYEKTESADIALELEQKFLDLGMNRASENSQHRSKAIFIYRKKPSV
jgi:hypothetical protein